MIDSDGASAEQSDDAKNAGKTPQSATGESISPTRDESALQRRPASGGDVHAEPADGHSPRPPIPQPLTIDRCFQLLFQKSSDYEVCLDWPPDVFAAIAYILELTGAYRMAVTDSWPPMAKKVEVWSERMHAIGIKWFKQRKCPAEVVAWWNTVIANKGVRISDFAAKDAFKVHSVLITAMLQICAVADECCSGFGMTGTIDFDEDEDSFTYRASENLLKHNLCELIEPAIAKVIPKVQTPQVGFNLRSLTHNLALWCHSEVKPKWKSYPNLDKTTKALNLLLVPWPYEVSPNRFKEVPATCVGMPDCFRFFQYEADNIDEAKLAGKVSDLIEKSCKTINNIDAVVFPELALSERSFAHLSRYLQRDNIILIAGTATPGSKQQTTDASNTCQWTPGSNSVRISLPVKDEGEPFVCEQFKHHRWKLDKSQIIQYSLGGSLGTDCSWWEHIDINNREVYFLQFDYWLTASVLICEDLARQDPVSTLVRAVGPNLVIALLLDGPQCLGRWADRYASVLADDPGSSVLSFTSMGMAKRSRPRPSSKNGIKTSDVIALWRDSVEGTSEIRLDDTSAAVAVSLNTVIERQFTADGREAAEYPRHVLILSGVHQIPGERTL